MMDQYKPLPRQRAGAKPKPPAEKFRPHTFNCTDAQWAKLTQLGGNAWIRARINAAKLPQS